MSAETESVRLDRLLTLRGLATSRAQAQRLIKSGRVQRRRAGGWTALTKVAFSCPADMEVRVEPDERERYVSRGALKLLGALERTGVSPRGVTALDVGQSTGGFTDCLLQAGASRVVGVDVGRDQLAPSLRADERVVALEGVNARALPADALLAHAPDGFALAVMDVSFISQRLILPSLATLLAPGGELLSLVKPQFEVGRQGIGKGGLVRDPALYPQVEADIRRACEAEGLNVRAFFDSPITGGDGNREFFIHAVKAGSAQTGAL